MTDYATGLAGAREDFCRYLAACYYEPSIDFAEERLFDSMLAAAGAIDPELAECTRANWAKPFLPKACKRSWWTTPPFSSVLRSRGRCPMPPSG
jgi:hypothetical protein